MLKTCRQCGRTGEDSEMFRQYKPRGTGARKTIVGYHTVCRDCENFNANALRIYNKPVKNNNDLIILASAEAIYRAELAKNLHPTGKYAKIILGDDLKDESRESKTITETIATYMKVLDITKEDVQKVAESHHSNVAEAAKIAEGSIVGLNTTNGPAKAYIQEMQHLIDTLENNTFDGDATDADFAKDDIEKKYKGMKRTPGVDYIDEQYYIANEAFAGRNILKHTQERYIKEDEQAKKAKEDKKKQEQKELMDKRIERKKEQKERALKRQALEAQYKEEDKDEQGAGYLNLI